MYKFLLTLFISCFFAAAASAQQPDTVKVKSKTDSLIRQKDKITSKPFVPKVKKEKVYHPDSTHLPHIAVMRSLEVPGWGQIYNHQWWKVPFIYGGLASFGYFIVSNKQAYNKYEKEALARRNGEKGSDEFTGVSGRYTLFQDAANNASRNYQLSILGAAALWGINVIDAYIQAKFQHSYSMDNNLGWRVSPALIPQPSYASTGNFGTFTPVLKVTFTLK